METVKLPAISNKENTYILLSDQHSVGVRKENRVTYGRKGEKVKEINDCGNVLIVESEKGDRYSVSKAELQQQ